MVIEELVGLGQLPAVGALFIFLPLKLVGGTGAPGRAIALDRGRRSWLIKFRSRSLAAATSALT